LPLIKMERETLLLPRVGDKPITKFTVCFDIFTIMFFNIPNPKRVIV
jgi:hypothetical protein